MTSESQVPFSQQKASISALPREILELIFGFTGNLSALTLACKAWRDISYKMGAKKSLKNPIELAKFSQDLFTNHRKGNNIAIQRQLQGILEILASKPSSEVLNTVNKIALEWSKLDKKTPLTNQTKTSHELAKMQYNTLACPKSVKLALTSLTSASNALENCTFSSEPAARSRATITLSLDSSKLNITTKEDIDSLHICSQNTFEKDEIVVLQLNHIAIRNLKDFVFGKVLVRVKDSYEIQIKDDITQWATPSMLGKIINMKKETL